MMERYKNSPRYLLPLFELSRKVSMGQNLPHALPAGCALGDANVSNLFTLERCSFHIRMHYLITYKSV